MSSRPALPVEMRVPLFRPEPSCIRAASRAGRGSVIRALWTFDVKTTAWQVPGAVRFSTSGRSRVPAGARARAAKLEPRAGIDQHGRPVLPDEEPGLTIANGHRAGLRLHRPPVPPAPSNTVLADEHTGMQHAVVTRHPRFGGQLFLDDDLQISESDVAYGVAMASPLLAHPRLERVAILGGGDGGVLAELIRTLEPLDALPSELTMVEIDPRVMALCREHLPALCGDAFDNPHARIVTGDAFAWIAQARDLDAVVYDLTMDPVREGQSRAEFITGIIGHIARALRPGGVLSMQCCGHGRDDAADRALRRE